MNVGGCRIVVPFLAVVCLLAACSGGAIPTPSAAAPSTNPGVSGSGAPSAAARAPLTVFGAASLKGALDQMKTAWEAANPGSTLTISTDSSSALETQIEQGAPADVFLSADTSNPKKLTDKGLADGAAVDFAGNILTVIVPTANPAGVKSPADLAKSGVKIIAAGDDVPITKYANQVVAKLAALPGYPADFQSKYAANVASKEDNVKAVVTKVELGEGDAGIVYVTDARASSKVAPIAIPTAGNVPAIYAGAVVKASPHAADAHAFLDWVAGPEGQAILASFGFLPPAPG
jgi:molybdate transport system substrate-binding protein